MYVKIGTLWISYAIYHVIVKTVSFLKAFDFNFWIFLAIAPPPPQLVENPPFCAMLYHKCTCPAVLDSRILV